MSRKRLKPITVRVLALPKHEDPIWLRGHRVVRLLSEYLDFEDTQAGLDYVP